MVLIIAILNDGKALPEMLAHALIFFIILTDPELSFLYCTLGTIMTISKDRVKPSPLPDNWKLKEIFATGIVLGGYLALMTVLFFWIMKDTDFFTV